MASHQSDGCRPNFPSHGRMELGSDATVRLYAGHGCSLPIKPKPVEANISFASSFCATHFASCTLLPVYSDSAGRVEVRAFTCWSQKAVMAVSEWLLEVQSSSGGWPPSRLRFVQLVMMTVLMETAVPLI
ncbi:TPA: hypothetical protein L6A07_29675 [Pseudomonas aeruginosa]|nr:hypothetical protein [Pseudomonas aeruginosa]